MVPCHCWGCHLYVICLAKVVLATPGYLRRELLKVIPFDAEQAEKDQYHQHTTHLSHDTPAGIIQRLKLLIHTTPSGDIEQLRPSYIDQSSNDEFVRTAPSWSLGSFTGCLSGCQDDFKHRTVECQDAFTGKQLKESRCRQPSPKEYKRCECKEGAEECEPRKPEICCPSRQDFVDDSPSNASTVDFAYMGCFEMHRGSKQRGETLDCKNATQRKWCHGLLPFYKSSARDMTGKKCSRFCVLRGFDIAGVAEERWCHCGATILNKNFLSHDHYKTHAAFNLKGMMPVTRKTKSCPLKIYRFLGIYENGSIPTLQNSGQSTTTPPSSSVTDGHLQATASTPSPEIDLTGVPWMVKQGPCSIDEQGCALSPNFLTSDRYDNSQSCLINVGTTGSKIQVKAFDTQEGADFISVLIEGSVWQFSGTKNPDGIMPDPGSDMSWTSDSSITATGWKLCPYPHAVVHVPKQESQEEKQAEPPVLQGESETIAKVWRVKSGPCSIDDQGCAMSPDFLSLGHYANSQSCEINVGTAGAKINVPVFDTELGSDVVSVRVEGSWWKYSGNRGPDQILPDPGSDILWTADNNGTALGWKLCPDFIDSQMPAPVPKGWQVTSGPCSIDEDGCASSPGFCDTDNYPTSQMCLINVGTTNASIKVDTFVTEQCFDMIAVRVGGLWQNFSGATSPAGIRPDPGTDIFWTSDLNVTARGWRLCPDLSSPRFPPPAPAPATAQATSPDTASTATPGTAPANELKPRPEFPQSIPTTSSVPAPVPAQQSTPAPTSEPVSVPEHAPAQSPNPTFSPLSNSSFGRPVWRVMQGSCKMDAQGCAVSPKFPGNYGNSQSCVIHVGLWGGVVSVKAFSTQDFSDILNVLVAGAWRNYSGTRGPDGVIPDPGSDILWTSDAKISDSGWKLCPRQAVHTPMEETSEMPGTTDLQTTHIAFTTRSPFTTRNPFTSTSKVDLPSSTFNSLPWRVKSGSCFIDDQGCALTSSDDGWNYGILERCEIEVGVSRSRISVTHFHTESFFDQLSVQVHGKLYNFSGSSGPDGLIPDPGSMMTWTSDEDSADRGWKMCPDSLVQPSTTALMPTTTMLFSSRPLADSSTQDAGCFDILPDCTETFCYRIPHQCRKTCFGC